MYADITVCAKEELRTHLTSYVRCPSYTSHRGATSIWQWRFWCSEKKIILTKNEAQSIDSKLFLMYNLERHFANIKILFLPYGGVCKMDRVSNTSFKLPAM